MKVDAKLYLIITMILVLKNRQALPGRPNKTTGRQARPYKKLNRHRQAGIGVGLSWAGQACKK